MTKEIPLTQGKVAIVDKEDYEELSKNNWWYDGRYATGREVINGRDKKIYMHRVITKAKDGE